MWKYHCTVDLLFDWFGLVCFANKNKNCQLSYCWFHTNQTGGQRYNDSSLFSIPWIVALSITAVGLMTLSITIKMRQPAQCHLLPSVVMLSAFNAQFHVIDIKLSVVKLNVFMTSVVAPRTDGLHQKLPFSLLWNQHYKTFWAVIYNLLQKVT